jgi:hypothetical protein
MNRDKTQAILIILSGCPEAAYLTQSDHSLRLSRGF